MKTLVEAKAETMEHVDDPGKEDCVSVVELLDDIKEKLDDLCEPRELQETLSSIERLLDELVRPVGKSITGGIGRELIVRLSRVEEKLDKILKVLGEED